MREILFRGKRADNGEWVESSTRLRIQLTNSTDWDIYLTPGNPATFYFDDVYNMFDVRYENDLPFAVRVIPETVGQFTGILDKNGKKIFEGDVIYNGHGDPGVVTWEPGGFMVHFPHGSDWDICLYVNDEYTRIIGNIHDNPELLKGE